MLTTMAMSRPTWPCQALNARVRNPLMVARMIGHAKAWFDLFFSMCVWRYILFEISRLALLLEAWISLLGMCRWRLTLLLLIATQLPLEVTCY